MLTRTKRQREILNFITGYIDSNGHQPSYNVIAREFNFSSRGAVAKHIVALEEQGHLIRQKQNGSFSIQLRSKLSGPNSLCEIEWIKLPGEEPSPEEAPDEKLLVPKFLIGFLEPQKLFAYRVTNDAMKDEHICEDDIALIEKRTLVRESACVLALVENERFVLKHFYRKGKRVELRPANPNYEPIVLPAEKVSIQGIFRGLLRPFC
jgi:repressor LexA